MPGVYIDSSEITKYVHYLGIFTTMFPGVLESSDVVFWVEDPANEDLIECLSYESFIDKYDCNNIYYIYK